MCSDNPKVSSAHTDYTAPHPPGVLHQVPRRLGPLMFAPGQVCAVIELCNVVCLCVFEL